MDKAYQEQLINAAAKLMEQSKTDSAVADQLLKDPAKAIAAAAGRPVPEGVRIIAKRSPKGPGISLMPQIDSNFKGELDDRVLDAVSGGYDPYGMKHN